jgi:hypothetical protein
VTVLPTYSEHSLAGVLPAAAGALGVEFTTALGWSSTGCAAVLDVPRAAHVVVVLCDGLGWENLQAVTGSAPFLRSVLPGARPLTTTFPATTASAMATFGTGAAPGQTGMLGYTLRNPRTGGLAGMVSWNEYANPQDAALPGAGKTAPRFTVEPRDLQREPTVFERLTDAGVTVTSVGPAKFADSGMTLACLRGGGYVDAHTLSQRVDATLRSVRAARGRPALTYLYWGAADKTGHEHGWRSWQWQAAVGDFDREMGRLCRSVPPGTVVLLTADHGHMEPEARLQFDVASVPGLAQDVAMIAGEPRAVHVYLAAEGGLERGDQGDSGPASDPERIHPCATRWRDVLGENADVLTRAEAIAAGWFGPVSPHVLPWMGDLVVAPRGNAIVVDSRTQSADSLALKGMHGSLTSAEMTIPLITYAA